MKSKNKPKMPKGGSAPMPGRMPMGKMPPMKMAKKPRKRG